MSRFGGAGFEAMGDPLGVGGALHVMRAIVVEGQTVRVVFNEEPEHYSPAGDDDALNPDNYIVTVTAGTAVVPRTVGVKSTLSYFPSAGVINAGEVGVDVQVDRPLVIGIAYRIAARNVVAKNGDTLGFPYAAPFAGMVRANLVRPPRRNPGLTDYASNPVGGSYFVDDSGDIATETGLAATKNRVLRRAVTRQNSFTYMPGYGTLYDPKKPANLVILQSFKQDLEQQIMREPDVAGASSQVQVDGRGYVIVDIKAQTKTRTLVDVKLGISSDGSIVIP